MKNEEFPKGNFRQPTLHPEVNDKGEPVTIRKPSKATPVENWNDKEAIATVLPHGEIPPQLNGVAFTPWKNHPTTSEGWKAVEGQDAHLKEPPLESHRPLAAGVVIEESDGRIWIIHPSNEFGGYKATFTKGRIENGISRQASAIKEAFEESGLKVEITGFLKDVEKSTTTTRYYTARRVGGTPSACGWETQAVSLVPRSKLSTFLNNSYDHPLAKLLSAAPLDPSRP